MVPIVKESRAISSVSDALRRCALTRMTGRVHVVGYPGGVVSVRDGWVVDVESPGSPGVAARLLRSRRIDEHDWEALQYPESDSLMSFQHLVARGRVRATELRLVAEMAWEDAVFAAAAGVVRSIRMTLGAVGAPHASEKVDPNWMATRVEYKVNALRRLPVTLSPSTDRLAVATQAIAWPTTSRQQEILAHVDGRRTARDIAYLVGRGLYPVAVDLSVLLADRRLRLVTDEPGLRTGTTPIVAPRGPSRGDQPAHVGALPRRHG
ncbi:hypothetical protein [Actinokineospora sp. HUAS TT18]|uniref:hypothetical protein n=1 Tax=Actinokineospora sp. HUAS TT18 TaxID=3447451 RepID=UPI003F51B53C